MRILLDQGFPTFVESYNSLAIELIRWNGGATSDVGMVAEACLAECQAVLFLGVQALASESLQQEANDRHIALGATLTVDPIEATSLIATHLGALAQHLRTGSAKVLLAREIRPWSAYSQR
jgi:hypothetical protein